MLKLKNISKFYSVSHKEVKALDDVSLLIDAGEFVVIKGPSGSGKSTLLFIAGALLSPDKGEVLIDNQNPYALSLDERAILRAEKIGFVFQKFHLIPYLSVQENALLPSILVNAENPHENAGKLVNKFGLNERTNHMQGELSTGERQRAALARAFMNSPKIILADEPTGNLDKENAKIVIRSLAEFAGTGGAVLLVTHDTYAAQCASRVLHLKAGKMYND